MKLFKEHLFSLSNKNQSNMKTYLSLLVILFSFSYVNAQYWIIPNDAANRNPGEINADAEGPFNSTSPNGWTVVLAPSTTPAWSVLRTLPFSFKFNNQNFSKFKISNSGVLTFDSLSSTAPGFTRVKLPHASIPNNSICVTGLAGKGANDNVIGKTFGTAPNRQYWLQFNSYGYGATASDNSNFTYWSIVLEETTNRIHIVDQRTGGYTNATLISIGLQIDQTTAYSVSGSPDLLAKAGTSTGPDDNKYNTFVQGSQGKYDVVITDITTSPYQVPGNVVIKATFRNLGTNPITSLQMNYLGNNDPVSSDIKNGLNIATFASSTITHVIPWNINAGTHNIEVFADNLNGSNADENPFDDKRKKKIFAMSKVEPRIPLFEIFSSSSCPPCKPANETYLNIISSKNPEEYVSIKYQQNFPGNGDPYATTEAINRRAYYFINSIPRMEIDGGWDQNGNLFTEDIYGGSQINNGYYSLKGTYKVEGKKVSATINYTPFFDAVGSRLHVAIVEGLTTLNVATNQETEFHHVMKKMLPNETGTILTAVPALTPQTRTFAYTFNGEYRLPINGQATSIINHATEHSVEEFEDLYVVAWIQGPDKQVFQAANLKPEGTTSVENPSTSFESFNIYPNPSSDQILIDINMLKPSQILSSIVDNNGNLLQSRMNRFTTGKQTLQYSIQDLPGGEYHLLIQDLEGNSSVHEFVKK